MRCGGLWQLGQSLSRRLSHPAHRPKHRFLNASAGEIKKTALHEFHVENGGKMVPFAGWSMPIQYKDSIMDSTVNCRENGSLFDVSHMCGLSLTGKDSATFLERLVVADVAGLRPGTGTLTVFTNERGGAIDDSVVTKVSDDHIYLVVNAGCRDKDLSHIGEHLEAFKAKGGDVSWHIHDERERGRPRESNLGEFRGKVRLTGLGARDSLRLEAGLCLYGNDMEQHITPVEAGLSWTIGKRRRAEGGFLGAEVILQQLQEGPSIRRVGLFSSGPPPRSHSEILSSSGEKLGEITSGGFSPCLKKNIAMGYVKSGSHKPGTEVKVVIRGKPNDAVITKMPFVPTRYYKSS
ncbi:hypothetical protein KSP40_PGU010750 [Platanthera guangdongensis]|uniref:Aminomethyltransferase n=1 Tax=Platanthera guangdongensis TaxID=2320717 RepID=A0ABR2LHX3_9ASPA